MISVVSTEFGSNGNVIKCLQGFHTNQSTWESPAPAPGAVQVVVPSDGRCVFLAPDGSTDMAQTGGNFLFRAAS